MVPRIVLAGSVAIVFAVVFVVLARIGNQIVEREAVVRDDVIDALAQAPRRRRVARSGDPGGQLAARCEHRRAKNGAPCRGSGRSTRPRPGKLPEPIAAGAEVPGFGDELAVRQHGVVAERLEERRVGCEAFLVAAERGREIEAKAVDAAENHPALQRRNRHLDDRSAVEGDAVAAARVVDVAGLIFGIEAEVERVVEAAERQRRAEFVALAVVVEDDVEKDFETRRVQRVDRGADLGPAARRQPRIGTAERHRIVAPRVGEFQPGRWRSSTKASHGISSSSGDAERLQMRDRPGFREGGEAAA